MINMNMTEDYLSVYLLYPKTLLTNQMIGCFSKQTHHEMTLSGKYLDYLGNTDTGCRKKCFGKQQCLLWKALTETYVFYRLYKLFYSCDVGLFILSILTQNTNTKPEFIHAPHDYNTNTNILQITYCESEVFKRDIYELILHNAYLKM